MSTPVVTLVTLLAVGLAVASAEEATEPADPAVVILEPGENLVGWPGEALPVDQLIGRFPAIESISAWEPLSGKFYEPTSLVAGQGYVLTLSVTEHVQWRRPMTPVKGKVTLERGRNLVTWLGPDDWTIDRVVLGIGRAFVQVEWEGGEHRASSRPTASPLPTLKRGDALWIEVSRTVNWLQPAGVLPRIVFAGSASEDIQEAVRQDSVDAMEYFLDEFGVQPDGSLLTVYVAADVDSLVDAFETDGIDTEGIHRTWYTAGGWANPLGHVVLKLEQWGPDYAAIEGSDGDHGPGRYVLVHEYYHVIQQQMSSTNAAQWLVEGGADWAEAGMRLKDTESSFDDVLAGNRNAAASRDAPPLDHTERSVGTWHCTLGALASHRLSLGSGE